MYAPRKCRAATIVAVCFARAENSSPLIHFIRHQGRRSAPTFEAPKVERAVIEK
jgi:hypothetical protein